MIRVRDQYGTIHESRRAEVSYVDQHNNLFLETSYGTHIATFAAGHWREVATHPSRDSKGRFTKKGGE